MKRKFHIILLALAASTMLLSGCSACSKATSLRHKAARKTGAERSRLEGQAASLEGACMKKRDAKYDNKMQKQFEDMEQKARN